MSGLLDAALCSTDPELALWCIYEGLFVFELPKLAKLDRANARLGVDLKRDSKFAHHFLAGDHVMQAS